jgi:hypothetical protein
VRLLLIVTLINGLVPSFAELAETAVHYAVEGHLAHSEAARCELGERGDEHGCGTTEHHCTCCASQVVMAPEGRAELAIVQSGSRSRPAAAGLVSLHEPAPPFRPPIAS